MDMLRKNVLRDIDVEEIMWGKARRATKLRRNTDFTDHHDHGAQEAEPKGRCPFCGYKDASALHVLRACPTAGLAHRIR